ncbi:response regulator transcription factor [Tenacibaculum maritimum]|nr:response regulator transcription factor [Tenacibaculum maritimum]MDB0601843.1 response regulator transcription factor [Tenacibaculum maritimum]MDB0613358.1 response regulator transcription factor [Tenacibaculum maritimum]
MKQKIKVHIADDHKILIEGIIALLNTDDEIEVEGYSLTGREVVEWSSSNRVDVLILDINMPEMDGIDVLRTFNTRNTEQKTIILSSLSDTKLVQEMVELGADGFLEKSCASEHIIKAIKSVHLGVQYFSDDIKNNLLNLYITKKSDGTKEDSNLERIKSLTEREMEVLKLVAAEKNSTEIADILNVSSRTVETYRRSLLKKLNVRNAVGLAMYAVKNNII